MKKTIVNGIEISNPTRVLLSSPLINKIDVVNYYASIGSLMLPYIENRLIAVIRCHNGLNSQTFFKKHPSTMYEGIKTKSLKTKDNETALFFYIDSVSSLIQEAQLGTIEFHPSASRVSNINNPDYLVFDLDPDDNLSLKKLKEGVRDLKQLLDELNLVSFLKTSGGKGYHIVVPFKTKGTWSTYKAFSKKVAQLLEYRFPNKYVSSMSKEKRKGKIFIDWLRNSSGATTVAPYSLRTKNRLSISFPISFNDLDNINPDSINIKNYKRYLKRDNPWSDYFKVDQVLRKI